MIVFRALSNFVKAFHCPIHPQASGRIGQNGSCCLVSFFISGEYGFDRI
jgi:hypothetical protein